MENFVVSARKYRPSTFETVVGQFHITNTLRNAIKSNHLAQAFLFCGPRGVGKTTCARILAKTINCSSILSTVEACNECESCKSFNSGQSLNIHELDGASNNSVEDMRNLIDQVRFLPQIGKYKIYIIDEVHMLTASAFNAFLKTLEEPPPHAIFILATTEKHKILPTILSRCQIFDFHRITIRDIAGQLSSISARESVSFEPGALEIIAQKADGAMRDALSIFDQLVNFTGNNLSYQAVIANLNILDHEYYFKTTGFLLNGNYSDAILTFNEILSNGFDGHEFLAGLGSHFRDLIMSKDIKTFNLLETAENLKIKYHQQTELSSIGFLFNGLGLINKCELSYKASKNQRLSVELTLMQLANLIENIAPKPIYIPAAAKPELIIREIVPEKIKDTSSITEVHFTPKRPNQPISLQTISIKKSAEEIKKQEEKAAEKEIILSDPFDEKTMIKYWNEYASLIKKDKPEFSSTLTNGVPSLNENGVIEFKINNIIQEEKFRNEKVDLLGFLKNSLKNTSIIINTILIESNEKSLRPYSNPEKFKAMAEKNPALLKLKQQLDLDID